MSMLRIAVGSLLVASALLVPGARSVHDDRLFVAAEALVAGVGAAEPLPACTDKSYELQGWKHTATYKWYYNAAGAPASVASTALATLQQGTNIVFSGQNRCGIAAKLSMSHAYQGTSTKTAQVSNTGTCTGNDSVSVTSWGDLPASTIAYTCTYYKSGGAVVASDLLIDNKLHPYYTTVNGAAKPATCANLW